MSGCVILPSPRLYRVHASLCHNYLYSGKGRRGMGRIHGKKTTKEQSYFTSLGPRWMMYTAMFLNMVHIFGKKKIAMLQSLPPSSFSGKRNNMKNSRWVGGACGVWGTSRDTVRLERKKKLTQRQTSLMLLKETFVLKLKQDTGISQSILLASTVSPCI